MKTKVARIPQLGDRGWVFMWFPGTVWVNRPNRTYRWVWWEWVEYVMEDYGWETIKVKVIPGGNL